MPAAEGLKVIEFVMQDGLAERAWLPGDRLVTGLLEPQKKYDYIDDVRRSGLIIGVEFVSNCVTMEPASSIGDTLTDRMRELGLSTNISRQKGRGQAMYQSTATVESYRRGFGR